MIALTRQFTLVLTGILLAVFLVTTIFLSIAPVSAQSQCDRAEPRLQEECRAALQRCNNLTGQPRQDCVNAELERFGARGGQSTCDPVAEDRRAACEEAFRLCRDMADMAERTACTQQAFRDFGLSSSADTGSEKLNDWLNRGITTLSALVGIVIIGSIIAGGIQYASAGGNASQVSAAKNRIFMAILALILFMFGFTLLQWLIPGGIF